jgi:hypothetical protein
MAAGSLGGMGFSFELRLTIAASVELFAAQD